MLSNLPPGLSESQIPGCTPDDHAIAKAQQDMACEACKYYDNEEKCGDCYKGTYISSFDYEQDEALILERLQASAEAREDGHIDG